MYSLYYQARIVEKECWFLVALLRSFEHLAFDRTVDRETSTFEFFVPPANALYFVELMEYFVSTGVVVSFEKLPNRLLDSQAVV